MELSVWQLVFCALVIVFAFTVRGAAGFGGGALAVPLLALALPVQTVIPVVTVLNFAASAEHGVRHHDKIRWREIAFVLPFTICGVVLGLYLLKGLDASVLRKGLGAFVMAYAVFAFATSARPMHAPKPLVRPLGAVLSAGAGLAGTLFGGAAGPLYAIHMANLRLDPTVFRVTITTTLLLLALMRIAGYTGLGLFQAHSLALLAVALPFMWVGGRVADRVGRRVQGPGFNRILGGALMLSGAALLFK